MSQRRPTTWAILLAAIIGLAVASHPGQTRHVYTSAQHFVGYFRALERDQRVGFLERVALSLVLAGTEESETPRNPCRQS